MDVEENEEKDDEVGPQEEVDLEMELVELSQEGIGDEESTQHDDSDYEDKEDHDDEQPWQYGAEMDPTKDFELYASCLCAESRVVSMKQTNEYWIATLLDPWYKTEMREFFLPSKRKAKLAHYREKLCSQLATAFKQQTPAASMSD